MFARSSISKIAVIALVAVTFSAIGALAGQSGQPAPAGAADNSAAMLGQLKLINANVTALNGRVAKVASEIGPDTLTPGLRGDIYDGFAGLCSAVEQLVPIPQNVHCPWLK